MGRLPRGAAVSHIPAAIEQKGGVTVAKRYGRPSLHYRYEHYDPRF